MENKGHESQMQFFEGHKVSVRFPFLTTREYKMHKGLTKESLRDNMTNMELLLNALAEETATQLSKERNPDGLVENAFIAKEGAEVARDARESVERRLGRSVISAESAIDHTNPSGSLPLSEAGDFDSDEELI